MWDTPQNKFLMVFFILLQRFHHEFLFVKKTSQNHILAYTQFQSLLGMCLYTFKAPAFKQKHEPGALYIGQGMESAQNTIYSTGVRVIGIVNQTKKVLRGAH